MKKKIEDTLLILGFVGIMLFIAFLGYAWALMAIGV